jgi:hypothetical protein
MTHHMLTGTIAALALVGSAAAQAQGADLYVVDPYVPAPRVYVAPPAYVVPPAYVAPRVYVAPPVVVAPAPGYAVAPPPTYVVPRDDYAYAPPAYVAPPAGYVTVDAVTGRRCTIKPDGYRWCWTP